MQLPRLYKITKTGATQVCDISTNGDIITVTFGQLDGKMQSKNTQAFPKNVGKSNETTGEQQAILEANAKYAAKIKEGYVENIDKTSVPSVKLPMKVKVYQDQIKNIKFPCISTPKYNGVNGLYVKNDTLELYSRGGEIYPEIKHLTNQVISLLKSLDTTELNGELYIPGFHLQDITSAVRKTNKNSSKIKFMLFDLPAVNKPYTERKVLLDKTIELLNEWREQGTCDIFVVQQKLCNSFEDIEKHYTECMSQGLEGTVIKNLDGLYTYNVRSSDQFKYKKALDAEYEVVGFEIDKNGHAVYQCATKLKQIFKVKRKGSNAERTLDTSLADQNIGKWLTIEYETLSKDGIPLKPVGLNFRKCDEQGNPVE